MNPRLAALLLVAFAAACAPQAVVEPPPAAAAAAPATPARAIAAVPRPAAPPPPPPPPVELAELELLTRQGVAALLGEPDLFREEAGAQVLLYSRSACALHVILYPPTPGAPPLVEHAETIPAAAETDSDRACLRDLLARQ